MNSWKWQSPQKNHLSNNNMKGERFLKDGALVKLTSRNYPSYYKYDHMLLIWKVTDSTKTSMHRARFNHVEVDCVICRNLAGHESFLIGIDQHTHVCEPTLNEWLEFQRFLKDNNYRYVPKLNKVFKITTLKAKTI